MAERNSISRMAMKAMGIFGGVQMIGIICSIVRTKLVALWIGPVGVGLFGLFNQALDMLNTATNLGIRQSSVRDISQAHENPAEQGHIRRTSILTHPKPGEALSGNHRDNANRHVQSPCSIAMFNRHHTFADEHVTRYLGH